MKKKGLFFLMFIVLIAPLGATFSQGSDHTAHDAGEQPSLRDVLEANRPSGATQGDGGTFYYTHPEFTNIMTTTVTTAAQNTAEGYIFVSASGTFYDGPSAVIMMDDSGEPVFIGAVPDDLFVADFKKQTVNGTDYLTYHTGVLGVGSSIGPNLVVNENYELVDSWTMGNGYGGADLHEFLLLDNGHAIVMAYVPVPFDLTPYGGPANGTLIDIVLQEQDENKNVVFEWHGVDHMPIGDTHLDLNSTGPVDYLHTNGIDVDDDGNWLLSHRNFSEITKIDRQTGEIIWRMGGAGNEFTFTNDSGFWNQHNINRLPNGNLTLFDNGNFHTPPHSRAVEYAVDEDAKTVTRVWVYPPDNSEFSAVMSNIQRLPNGNSMIGWGSQEKFTEVESDGTVALEVLLGVASYRTFRFTWEGTPTADPRGVVLYGADPTAVTIYTSWNGATDITGYDVYAGATLGSLALVGNWARTGFETEIAVNGLADDTCFFQTKPVHGEGNPTPFSNLMFRLDLEVCWDQLDHAYMPLVRK